MLAFVSNGLLRMKYIAAAMGSDYGKNSCKFGARFNKAQIDLTFSVSVMREKEMQEVVFDLYQIFHF